MYILVPWKPVVIAWLLLSGMIFAGFVGSSLLQGKDPFAPPARAQQSNAAKAGATHTRQQPDNSHKAPASASH